MSKKRRDQIIEHKGLNINADAVIVCREKGSHLLFNAYKLKIVKGVVKDIEQLTRASDMFKIAVNKASQKLWEGKITSTNEVFGIEG